MTGLINTASNADPALHPQLCGPVAGVDTDLVSASQPDPEAWRSEVAARLARSRTRRKPRAPRYPSLLLPFDSSDNWSRSAAVMSSTSLAAAPSSDHDFPLHQAHTPEEASLVESSSPHSAEHPPAPPDPEPEPSAKVIEFPRSAAIPTFHASLLADPIFDRPRIVEAPEVVPPPPALGGILIEPIQPVADPRTGAESRIQSASIPRRVLAAALDGLILAAALSAFTAIFLRVNPVRGPLPLLAGAAAIIAVLLWMAYQFLFVVYTGSTPGLRLARLRLANFDGSPVSHRLRRWRVLASFLSAFSAALGYLWCFLDQDSLCWHDRITRTHLRPAGSRPSADPVR